MGGHTSNSLHLRQILRIPLHQLQRHSPLRRRLPRDILWLPSGNALVVCAREWVLCGSESCERAEESDGGETHDAYLSSIITVKLVLCK